MLTRSSIRLGWCQEERDQRKGIVCSFQSMLFDDLIATLYLCPKDEWRRLAEYADDDRRIRWS